MYTQTPVPDVYQGIFGGANCRDSPFQVITSVAFDGATCLSSVLSVLFRWLRCTTQINGNGMTHSFRG